MMSADSQQENVDPSTETASTQKVEDNTAEKKSEEQTPSDAKASSDQSTEKSEAKVEFVPEASAEKPATTEEATSSNDANSEDAKKVELKPTIGAGLEKAVPSLEPGTGIVAEAGEAVRIGFKSSAKTLALLPIWVS